LLTRNLIASAGDRLANQFFRSAIGVHFRGIDECHAEIQPEPQGFDFLLPSIRAFGEVPSALAQYGNGFARWKLERPHFDGLHGSVP
jgi:hypothetical protein